MESASGRGGKALENLTTRLPFGPALVSEKEVRTTEIAGPFGIIRLTVSAKGLQKVEIVNTKSERDLQHDEGLKSYSDQVEKYLEGVNTKFDLPLDIVGTDFQKAVWKEASKIPYGKTVSYQKIAMRINNPRAVRAVGSALGDNPVCIVIPCHRVLPKEGGTGQYAYGQKMKQWLLAHESGQTMA